MLAGSGAHKNHQRLELAEIRSKELFSLFIAVIRILTHYCKRANDNVEIEGTSRCAQLAGELNSRNREAILLALLQCNDDQVRKAVVICLKEVPLKELDEQVGLLMRT